MRSWGRLKFIALTLMIVFFGSVGYAQRTVTIKGTVVSENENRPLAGVTVGVRESGDYVRTDRSGYFEITTARTGGVLTATHLGYKEESVRYSLSEHGPFRIVLSEDAETLEEVLINTGYQSIPKERATGSFGHIGPELLNRSVSPDVLTRLENLSPGLLFNHGDAANTDAFLIRGRSTINGEAQPLIVLDDFPYDGDLGNINPNDIESVSILRDAAAASIWGARAGNGVIVLTTKKGRTAAPQVELKSNVTFTPRPDLYNIHQMLAPDRVELERFLFENGRYASAVDPATLASRAGVVPDAVELMIQNPSDLEAKLNGLGDHNVLDDLSGHFYRVSTNQQYSLNISGRQEQLRYYMSGSFDRNLPGLVGESHSRLSIRSSNSYRVNDRLGIDVSLNLYNVEDSRGNNEGINTSASAQFSLSPYARLVDDSGNAAPVYMGKRKGYVDTVGGGRLLDWNYRPLEEIENEKHSIKRRDYMIHVGANYQLMEGLEALAKYQFQNQVQQGEDIFLERSYYARNNINDFARVDPATGAVSYPFPRGGILWRNVVTGTSHQGRAQLNFDRELGDRHSITAIGGFEIRKLVTSSDSYQNLGYDDETGTIENVINTEEYYPRNSSGTYSRIMAIDGTSELRDHFLSYFSNAAYTYDKRYTVSGSLRKDEANLFGLNTNQKGTPLWSLGGAWELSNEGFYRSGWLPRLKLRIAYGSSGNIARNANAVTTITTSTGGFTHPLPSAYLNSLPNRNLSWEKVKQLNAGLDFATKGNRISGTIEIYTKRATDLLSQSAVDPTYGVSSMYLNVGDMSGKGVDMQFRTLNLRGKLNWQTDLIYSYSSSKITKYLMPTAPSGSVYLPISLGNPLIGRPLFSVFALQWKGLDRETGNPIGVVDGEESVDYNAIYNTTPLEDLVFVGTAQPTHFGAFRNSFNYGAFDLSFNISYKLGYYFRRASIHYTNAYEGDWRGHSDYGSRWKQPGDELTTHVPSRVYPAVPARDNFYRYSEVLVEKGDHVRFEDVDFGYSFRGSRGIKAIRVFAHISDLGVLWKANKSGIDPYYHNRPLQRPSFSFGTNLTF